MQFVTPALLSPKVWSKLTQDIMRVTRMPSIILAGSCRNNSPMLESNDISQMFIVPPAVEILGVGQAGLEIGLVADKMRGGEDAVAAVVAELEGIVTLDITQQWRLSKRGLEVLHP